MYNTVLAVKGYSWSFYVQYNSNDFTLDAFI